MITPQVLKATRLFLRVGSYSKMAEVLGVSTNTYMNWELGRRQIPLWVQNFLIALVKNVEIIEIGMVARHYVSEFLKEPKVAARMYEYYPHFNLEHVVNFPMFDFMFETLSAVPFTNIKGRLDDFLAGKETMHPTQMRAELEKL